MTNNIPGKVVSSLNEAYTSVKESEKIYGKTTLQFIKNKWYVCITVPTFLRQKIGFKQLKLSTGTSNGDQALLMQVLKAKALYQRLAYADFHQDAHGIDSEYDV